jgi:DNA-binding transcriptional LysR family regulator
MRRTNLDEILVFMAVVDGGSFVAGGRAMGLTGSAASKAVIRLEERLGRRLLHRTTRAVGLTDEGRALYENGLRVLEALERAEAGVEGGEGVPSGTLRLSVPASFGRRVVLPVLQRYLDRWPSVRAEVSFTDRLVDLVEEGVDLAIRIGGASAEAGLISRRVAAYRTLLCAAPAYLAARGQPAYPDALAEHHCLLFKSRADTHRWRYRGDDGGWVRIPTGSRLRLDSGEALRDAAVAGLGIAFLPEFLVAEDLAAGRLHEVLPELRFEEAPIVLLYPSKRLLEPRVRLFIDLMARELAG